MSVGHGYLDLLPLNSPIDLHTTRLLVGPIEDDPHSRSSRNCPCRWAKAAWISSRTLLALAAMKEPTIVETTSSCSARPIARLVEVAEACTR